MSFVMVTMIAALCAVITAAIYNKLNDNFWKE
jgi:hypothetical protein